MEWEPLYLSFKFASFAIVIAGIVGIALAGLLASRPFRGRELIDVLITVPMVLPPTVLGYYLLVSLGVRSTAGRAFERVTGTTIVFTETAAVIAMAIVALPLVVKSARAALESVDPLLVNAARTLGASPTRVFVAVKLPLAARGIFAGVMLGFARALGDFGVTLMVAGNIPRRTQTAPLAIYDLVQANRQTEAEGMIVVLTALAIVALYLANRVARRSTAT